MKHSVVIRRSDGVETFLLVKVDELDLKKPEDQKKLAESLQKAIDYLERFKPTC